MSEAFWRIPELKEQLWDPTVHCSQFIPSWNSFTATPSSLSSHLHTFSDRKHYFMKILLWKESTHQSFLWALRTNLAGFTCLSFAPCSAGDSNSCLLCLRANLQGLAQERHSFSEQVNEQTQFCASVSSPVKWGQ